MSDERRHATPQGESPMTVDRASRWEEIQALSRKVASKDGAPTEIESALCGAVVRAREWLEELEATKELFAASVARSENGELKERLEVVECLAKRICRDLRHALDDVPSSSPMKEMMVERYKQFKADLGDTSEYVHALHYTIRRFQSDAERYRWLRDDCTPEQRIVIAEYADKPDLLDHHVDKGRCGL